MQCDKIVGEVVQLFHELKYIENTLEVIFEKAVINKDDLSNVTYSYDDLFFFSNSRTSDVIGDLIHFDILNNVGSFSTKYMLSKLSKEIVQTHIKN